MLSISTNMLSKKILLFCTFLTLMCVSFADDFHLRNHITETLQDLSPSVNADASKIDYVAAAKVVKYWIFAFIGVIAVWYIIAVGAKLLWAPGGEEDTTNAIKSIAYVAVGLALLPMAYFIVDFIINFRI